jgi:hypothetical protein
MKAFLARLQEPSTHAALAGLAPLVGGVAISFGASPALVQASAVAASAVFGLLGVVMKEGQ